jgi:ribosomal protein L9
MHSAVSMLLAMLVKTAVSVWLLQIPSVGIYGAVVAASVGYATSFLFDLFFALYATKHTVDKSA